MAGVTSKEVHTLISYYLKKYGERYERDPRDFNRFRDKWGFQSMIEQYGLAGAKDVVDYYMSTRRVGHPVNYLLYNYEKLYEIMMDKRKDKENRERLIRESKKRVEEWRDGEH